MFQRMMAVLEVTPRMRRLPISLLDSGSSALQSAGHAVLRTLYSRAYRIVLNGASCLLHGLCKNVSFECFLPLSLGRMVAQPMFEVVVPFEKQLECFADDVGRICADEFGVSVQVASDFFLHAQ
jgi:hypothetical protein